MDPVSASEIALQIPDLLATVLRCLGPLEWVKCASVCPDWCDAILSRDKSIGARGTAAAAAAASAATTIAPPPATRSAASTKVVKGGGTIQSTDGQEEEKEKEKAAAAALPDLWREFALTLMARSNGGHRSPELSNQAGAMDGGRSYSASEHSALVSCFHPHATTGITARGGGRLPSSNHVRGCFYRNVCLEGDPAVLGPPLRATAAPVGNSSTGRGGVVEVATVSLRDVTAASLARYRQRRVFIKFLSLWTRNGGPATTKRVQLEVTHNDLRVTLDSPLARRQASKRGSSAKAAAASATERASSRSISSNGNGSGSGNGNSTKRASRPPRCCTTTTALLHDALSVFTRLLVLCRRCRRPCTTLFATENSDRSNIRRLCLSHTPHGGGTGCTSGKATVGPESSRCGRGGGVALWVECQGEGCGVTSWVGVAAGTGGGCGGGGGGTDPPPIWLAKFSRFVLNRAWKDINALAEDHGTEWFSDTSPAAVQRRQDEARARSIGLDALASRGGANGGGDTSDGD